MSYQTYSSSRYPRRQSNEYGAAQRNRGQSPRNHQHAAWSSDYISEPVYSISDDYISPQDPLPPSAHYESPSMSSVYRTRQRGPTLDQTCVPYQPRYDSRRTVRKGYRSPSPGPDDIAQSVQTEHDYMATPARTMPGAFVDEDPEYSPGHCEYRVEDDSPLRYSAPRDYDGRREVYDSPPPHLERSHRQYPRNSSRSHKPGSKQSHGRKSYKIDDYQEAKPFFDRFRENDRRVDPSDEESDRSDDDSDWHHQHAYNARCNTPDDFQAVKEALERIRAIGAPNPTTTKAAYAPHDDNMKRNKNRNKNQTAGPRRRRHKDAKEERRWDAPNPLRQRTPQTRLDDYKEAKQFLARFQALEAKIKREEEEEEEEEEDEDGDEDEEEEEADRSDEEEYSSESASDHDYPCNEAGKQSTRSHVIEAEQEQRWDAPHSGAARKSRLEWFETNPAPISTAKHEYHGEARSPSPPASDIASYRSASVSSPACRVSSTTHSYRSRSRSRSRSLSVPSQASDCSSTPMSESPAPSSQSRRSRTQALPPPLPCYSSFSRPPQHKPGFYPNSRSRSRSNKNTNNSASESDDNGIAEGSDYLPSDSDSDYASARDYDKGATLSDDNGVGEGSDYLSSGDDDDDASDIASISAARVMTTTTRRRRNSDCGVQSESGDDRDRDLDRGEYMRAGDEGWMARRYYGR